MSSLRKRIPLLIVLMMLPVLLFTSLTLGYSGRKMRREVIETNASALDFYLNELENSLDDIQSYLLNFSVFNNDLAGLNSPDHDTRKITQSVIIQKLKQDMVLYDAQCLFAYAPDYDCLAIVYGSGFTYQESLALREFLKGDYEKYITNYHWKTGRIGAQPYLYQLNCSQMRGNCLFGAIYSVGSVQSRLMNTSENLTVVLTGEDCKPLTGARELIRNDIMLIPDREAYTSGSRKETVLSRRSKHGFILWEIFPQNLLIGSISNIFWLMAAMAGMMAVCMAVSSILIYRWVLFPLHKIDKGLSALASGDLDYRIETAGDADEYRKVGDSFNLMTGQIQDLKIRVYEENIRRQESELNFLYMQMRPHFFLNALTTIRNFASLGQYENMTGFIGYLGEYIRYSLRRHVSDVSFSQELGHIENYIAMQNLQHPNSVLYMPDYSEEAGRCLIPPFIVYTFVENCIKHALSLETPLSIFITAQRDGERLYVTVEDDSTGFPEDILKKSEDPAWLNDTGEKHIGIRNVKRTLQLRYGEKALLRLSNTVPMGAKVEILIPAVFGGNSDSVKEK